MERGKHIRTKKRDIVDYWRQNADKYNLDIQWAEADKHCWRCGCNGPLDRCHIIPVALGGRDEPENFVLLCRRCHIDGPNINNPEIMWDWIKAYNGTMWDAAYMAYFFDGLAEYERMYGTTFEDDLKSVANPKYNGCDMTELGKKGKLLFFRLMHNASTHFGQLYLNASTMAGILRMFIKEIECGI